MNILLLTTEKCFLKMGNETKKAFLVDLAIQDPRSLKSENATRKFYATEDWDVVPAREGYVNGLISPEYLKLHLNFDDTWESNLPVYNS